MKTRHPDQPLPFRCGIEYEYLLCEQLTSRKWQLHSHLSLGFATLSRWLDGKPGRNDPQLATGDLGVKSGYWYLEGDERFDAQGGFADMAVKGVEIRTPPHAGVEAAIASLLAIERKLTLRLAGRGFSLAIAGFHPQQAGYEFTPPLNAWEQCQRARHQAYAAAHVSTLSFGPDINLSFPHFSRGQALAATRRLIWWGPYLVPFSFSSPCHDGVFWDGLSKRTFERHNLRPTARLFWEGGTADGGPVYPPRLPSEQGRIEFKAFDAIPSQTLLAACCYLLVGLCLADDRPEQAERASRRRYQQAAVHGFADPVIREGAGLALGSAQRALARHGLWEGLAMLEELAEYLAAGLTPAHRLREQFRLSGELYLLGGLRAHPVLEPIPGREAVLCHPAHLTGGEHDTSRHPAAGLSRPGPHSAATALQGRHRSLRGPA